MLKNIVVAVDGSDQSLRAVRLGGALADKFDAKLTIVHVLMHKDVANLRHLAEVEHLAEPLQGTMAVDAKIAADVRAAMRDIAEHSVPQKALLKIGENVARDAEDLAKQSGAASIDIRVEDGDPVQVVLEVAEAVKADMILTGKRGHGPLHDLLLGSVSARLAQLAPCTCVTVH